MYVQRLVAGGASARVEFKRTQILILCFIYFYYLFLMAFRKWIISLMLQWV